MARSKILHVRVTEKKWKTWKTLADGQKLSLSEWSRKVIEEVLKQLGREKQAEGYKTENKAGIEEGIKKDVRIRLTPSEVKTVVELSSDYGWSRQELFIRLLRSFATQSSVASKKELEVLIQMVTEVRKIGVNINQMAKRINIEAAEGVTDETIKAASETITEVNDLMERVETKIEDFLKSHRNRDRIIKIR